MIFSVPENRAVVVKIEKILNSGGAKRNQCGKYYGNITSDVNNAEQY